MKAFIALAFLLLLIGSAVAQPSTSNTPSNSNSGSISGSSSGSSSGSGSGSGSASNSGSGSNTHSQTASGSNTVTPPPAPINVVNLCLNHDTYICPSWTVPAGVYVSYIVAFTPTGGATTTVTTFQTSGRVSGLTPGTDYVFVITGVTASGLQGIPSAPVTFTTSLHTDLSNIVCDDVRDGTTRRNVIQCTWTAASPPPDRLVIKWRCVSAIRLPDSHKKRYYGAGAAITSVQLNVHRDVATCTVFFHPYYIRQVGPPAIIRPGTRRSVTVIMGS